MANIINADDGSVSGIAGIKQTADASGALILQANGVNAVSISNTAVVTVSSSISGNGAGLTNINASNISSGTVATARLASGTANSSTYLRGDSTWAALSAPNNGTLTMNTSGTGISGSATFTADQSGNSTFTVASNANSANGASTIVARDSSGNFTANAVTLTTGSFAGGSNTAPSITFTGDTNTGIYSPAADTIAFTEGGVESMRIDSSGNVGIGTSSPGVKLEVNGTGELLRLDGSTNQNRQIYFRNVGTGTARVFTDGTMTVGSNAAYPVTFITQDSERMRIDSSGNVGIGISDPASFSARLTVAGNIGASAGNALRAWDPTNTTFVQMSSPSNRDIRWTNDAGTEYFRFGNSGQLGIGGANYGSSGQVLTSNGSGSAPSWSPVTLPAGTVLQVQQFETTATGTFGNSPAQLPGPFQVTITPSSASNKILIMCQINIGFGNGDCRYPGLFLRRNGSNINVGNKGGNNGTNVTVAATQQTLNVGSNSVCGITYLDSPGTTSAVTYSVWGQADFIGGDRTNYLNRPVNLGDAMRLWTASNIIAMEIKG